MQFRDDVLLQQTTVQPVVDEIALVVKGMATQTNHLQQWQNSAGSMLSAMTASGNLLFSNALGSHYSMASGNAGYVIGTAANDLDIRGGSSGLRILNNAGSTALLDMTDAGVFTFAGDVYLGNPGAGADRRIQFTKTSDYAWISVAEWTTDQTTYTFGMHDNPDGTGDKFRWYIGDWHGIGGDWEPLLFTDRIARTVGRQINQYGVATVQGPFFTGGATGGLSGNQTSGTPGQVYSSETGTLSITPDVAAYSSTSTVKYWVRINGTGAPNTFDWGTGQQGATATATAVAITGAAQTLSNGVTVTFSGTTGGVAGDIWHFAVYPGGTLVVGGSAKISNSTLSVYTQQTNSQGIVIREASGQTANLQEWQNSGGTPLAWVDPNGFLYIGGGGAAPGGELGVTAATSGSRPMVIRGAASQTANLTEWQDSGTAIVARISATGGCVAQGFNSLNGGWDSHIGGGSAVTGAALTVNTGSAARWGLVVKGAASQTANLQQWQDSAGTVLSRIRNDGLIGAPYITNTVDNGPYIQFSAGDTRVVNRNAVGNIPLIVKGMAGQTGDLQQWQDSGAVIKCSLSPSGDFYARGRTNRFSNFLPEYRWKWGGGQDLAWKTICNLTITTGSYAACVLQVDIFDAGSNYGSTANCIPLRFYAAARRSGGVQDDTDSGEVSGPIADYVRLVKTALGVYELQVRQVADWKNMEVVARVISTDKTTISYVDDPVDGSTTGTNYMPIVTGYTQRFPNVLAGGTILGSNFSGPATTVVGATTFGLSSVVGTSVFMARQDHSHGTPAAPTVHTHDGTGGATSLVIGGTAEAGASIPVASSVGAIAIGDFANAGTGTQVIAIGTGVNATAAPSASAQGAIAIGASNGAAVNGARASGLSSVAIGTGDAANAGASATGAYAIAVGQLAAATGTCGIGIGPIAVASSNYGIAVGLNATASTGTQAVALGSGVSATAGPQATGQGGIALGASNGSGIAGARAGNSGTIAIGSGDATSPGAFCNSENGIAIGRAAIASTNVRIIAIGHAASSDVVQSIALGTFARCTTNGNSISIGSGQTITQSSLTSGNGAIAIGSGLASGINGARASGETSIAIGGGPAGSAGASAVGTSSVAIGAATSVNHTNSVALGRGATTTAANQIMLGTTTETVRTPGRFDGVTDAEILGWMN